MKPNPFELTPAFSVQVWEEEGGSLDDGKKLGASLTTDAGEEDMGEMPSSPFVAKAPGLKSDLARAGYSLEEEYFYRLNRELTARKQWH